MRKRGFEIVSKFKNEDINLPVRKTNASAGYDFEAAESLIVPSIWKVLAEKVFIGEATGLKATLIPTGIKSYMLDDEYLQLSIRSGTALKTGLILANGVGIVDSDYYNNPDNEGHIMIALLNFGNEPVTLEKGERVAQGIFSKYLITNDDDATGVRTGGIGSTGTM